ncbi:MAG: sugar ABC transporter permease [Spirochaetales bacterium]|nr:sugar ABC transporter permease [Spirochaetales bacterium]
MRYMIPALTVFSLFFIIPNISSFYFAFTNWTIFDLYSIKFNGLDNFRRLINEDAFKKAVINTLYFAVLTTVLKNILGLLFALGIHKQSKPNDFIRAVLFIPVTISTLVVAVTFVAIYNPETGILNTFLRQIGLDVLAKRWLVDIKYAMTAICAMEIWQWTGYSMVIFLAGIKSIPDDFYDAAKIDGANLIHTLKNITIPLIMPSINVSLLMTTILGLKVFAQVYATTNGGPINATQVIGTFMYKTFSDGFLGYSSAVGLVMTLTILLITLLILPRLRKMEVEY